MKRQLLVLGLVCFSLTVFAQDTPKVEIFGGYSFTRLQPTNSVRRENMNGGHTSVTFNRGFMDWVIDFSAYKGNHGFVPLDLSAYNLLAGVRFGRRGKKFSWFIQQLYGVSLINTELAPGGGVAASISKRGTMNMTGGFVVDAKLNDRIALRLFQADLMFIQRAYPLSSITPRISTGIIFRLGKK